MKRIFQLAALIMFSVATFTVSAASLNQQTPHVTKSGAPDKRYKENQHFTKSGAPDKRYSENQNLKKDGSKDMRFKANQPAASKTAANKPAAAAKKKP